VNKIQQWWKSIGREFHSSWKNFLFQSVLAAITVFVVFLFLHREQAVIIAAIGGTAFIVFIMPSANSAKSQNVIGGHLIGFVSGMLGVLILRNTTIEAIVVYALVVGISIFFMVTFNLEHPPASGTALGVAISGYQSEILIAILTSTIILSLGHHFLRKYLIDLVK
jgi:CBS-domain-containing membrane protein